MLFSAHAALCVLPKRAKEAIRRQSLTSLLLLSLSALSAYIRVVLK